MSTTTNDIKKLIEMVNKKCGSNIILEENWEKFEFILKENNGKGLILCISNCEGCYQFLQGMLYFREII